MTQKLRQNERRNNSIVDIKELQALFGMARGDRYYSQMITQYQKLESEVDQIIRQLTETEQNVIWKFICISDEMNLRVIELLCDKYDLDIANTGKGQ